MRISDWSSDVCSSDLGRFLRLWRQPRPVRARLALSRHCSDRRLFLDGAVHWRCARTDDVRRAADDPAGGRRSADGSRTMVPARGTIVRLPPALRRRRWEENTCEIQLLMRHSYAVFCLIQLHVQNTQTKLKVSQTIQ